MKLKTVINNRASVCTWDLQFYFLRKEQCQFVIEKFMKIEIPMNFSYREENFWEENRSVTRFIIEIKNMPWANNLTHIAEILESVDHK